MTTDRKPRYALQLQIVYDDGKSFMSGPVADMSESGVFIETVMPLDPGTAVTLQPLLPDDEGIPELPGVVVRKADYDLDNHFDRTPGMGIRFGALDDEQRAAVARLLAQAPRRR